MKGTFKMRFIFIAMILLFACNSYSQIQGNQAEGITINNKPFFSCYLNPFGRFGLEKPDEIDWETGNYDSATLMTGFKMSIEISESNPEKCIFNIFKNDSLTKSATFIVTSRSGNRLTMRPAELIAVDLSCNCNGEYYLETDTKSLKLFFTRQDSENYIQLILTALLNE